MKYLEIFPRNRPPDACWHDGHTTPQSRRWHPPDTSLDMSSVAVTSHVNANARVYRQRSRNQLEQSSHFSAMAEMEFPRRNSRCVCVAIASVLIIHDTQTADDPARGLTNWRNRALLSAVKLAVTSLDHLPIGGLKRPPVVSKFKQLFSPDVGGIKYTKAY